ncbi:MAG: radical SAM protein, partial [Deltaproteobacteria bacterium]
MELSRHNLLTKIHDSDEYVLVNLLSGEADVIPGVDGERLTRGEVTDAEQLAAKGYLVDPAEEQRRFRAAYLSFVETRATDEVQLFYVPSYACNFACSYCFQDDYAPPPASEQEGVLDAFFMYVDDTFADRRKYVTLFGGEPLLPSPGARRVVERMIDGTVERGLDLAVVTNGY